MDKLEDRIGEIIKFNKLRGWNPKCPDLAKSVIIEAAELLEHFQWDEGDRKIKGKRDKEWNEVAMEVADVFWYLVSFCHAADIDLSNAVKKKMKILKEKYPADKFNGRHNDKFYKSQKLKYRLDKIK